MRDVFQRYMDAGLGMLGSERAEELARDLIEWSRKSTERVVGIVQREVRKQMKAFGVATEDEVRELRKRVRTLERQLEKAGGGSSSASKKRGSKRSSAKRSAAKRGSSKSSGSSGSSRGS